MSVARFWRHLPQRYNMVGTKCEKCGRHFFPPRTFCPDCRRAGKIVEHKFIGSGTVVTYTVIHTAAEQYAMLTPYVLAIVKLDEGPQITTQIVCRPDQGEDRDEGQKRVPQDRHRWRERHHPLRHEVCAGGMRFFFFIIAVGLRERIIRLQLPGKRLREHGLHQLLAPPARRHNRPTGKDNRVPDDHTWDRWVWLPGGSRAP